MKPTTSQYVDRALKAPNLSREEETRLAKAWHYEGDENAKADLIAAHLKDVVYAALKQRSYHADLADLIAAGNYALVQAIKKYDPDRGIRFETYASYWVRAYMTREVLRTWSVVQGGDSLQRRFFKVRRAHARLLTLLGDVSEVAAGISEEMDLPVDDVHQMINRFTKDDLSLDSVVPGTDSLRPLDRLTNGDPTPEDTAEHRELIAEIDAVLEEVAETLEPIERHILDKRLLQDEGDRQTLAQIGQKYRLSRERIRQIEMSTKKKLRNRIARRWEATDRPLG